MQGLRIVWASLPRVSKCILIYMLVMLGVVFGLDIFALYQEVASGYITTAWLKWSITCSSLVLVLLSLKHNGRTVDRLLVSFAFTSTLLADTFFALARTFYGPRAGVFTASALLCFVVVQAFYIFRHGRGTWWPKNMTEIVFSVPIFGAIVFFALFLLLLAASLSFVLHVSAAIIIAACYGIILVVSFSIAWIAFSRNQFPKLNSWLIAIGLTLYALGDITVGTRLIGLEISAYLRCLTWVIYMPTLAVLALSAWDFRQQSPSTTIKERT